MILDIQGKKMVPTSAVFIDYIPNPRNKSNGSIFFFNLVIKWSGFTNIINGMLGKGC